jgi:hypothetical protein
MGQRASVALGLALLTACARRHEDAPGPQPKTDPLTAPSSAPSAPSAPSTPSASVSAPVGSADDEAARRIVRAWNDALDRHELAKLEALYTNNVRFYGTMRSRTAVIALKRAALAKQPAFRQEIVGEISLARGSEGVVRASFMKQSGPPEHVLVSSATLALTPILGGFLIVEEGDEVSAPGANAAPADCESTAAEVTQALPEVKLALEAAMAEAERSDGGANFGGVGPNDDGDGSFSAAMGLHTEQSFQARVAYSVDKSGRLTVMVGADQLVIPREALRSVATVCRH